ncbi:MAG TPA: hypothetical protein VFU86_23245 [Terriglobales bacterium]|nr:hypothetical protein [Terriglobales bacterium]
MLRSRRFLAVLSSSLLFLTFSSEVYGQRGAITVPRSLAELTSTADRIVEGKVVSARIEPHPEYKNLSTVVVTISIDENMKGTAHGSLTFRQFIWDIRDVQNAAGYRAGEQVFLFLNRTTPLGLTSPVGLGQGRFRVSRNRNGVLVAVNDNGNSGLFQKAIQSGALNVSQLSPKSRSAIEGFRQGAISLDALRESVQVLLKNQARAK